MGRKAAPRNSRPRIIVAPTAFKETFTPLQAAKHMVRGIGRVLPARFEIVPIADGGDGTLESLRAALGGRLIRTRVTGPLSTPVRASYLKSGRTAVIEMAEASGLKLVPPKKRDPLVTTSRGTGELILHAWKGGARKILLGVGGSATVDGGAGALAVLNPQICGAITVLCDVENPLLGTRGAAPVFGPQKGATPAKVRILAQRLRGWAEFLKARTGVDIRWMRGAGAAGGLSGGFAAFGARLVPGAPFILKTAGLPRPCDVIVTGEGRIDRTSIGGKAVGEVLRLYRGTPVILVCGKCELPRKAFETGRRSAAALEAAAERAGRHIKAILASGR